MIIISCVIYSVIAFGKYCLKAVKRYIIIMMFNGVFLPTVKNVSEAAYHPSLHTKAYYEKVTELLSSAQSKEDVIEILNDIAEQLQKGTFI